jgi:peptide/nickel transport system substrate-binding protein
MKRIAISVLVLGAAATLAAAASSRTNRPHAIPLLRVGLAYTFPTLDASRNVDNFEVLGLELEPIVRISPAGKLEPWLAQSVNQPNATTYVYHLRHGVRFRDGNELTATDVANAYNYYRYPGSFAERWFRSVRSITAKDKYTVVVTLKHRDASWPFQPAIAPGVFEKAFQDAHKTTLGQPGTLTMGTGPWHFDSLGTGGAELSANPRYWHGAPNIQHISMKFFSDETSEGIAFRAGELDLAFPKSVRTFAAASRAKVVSVPGLTPLLFSLNTLEAPWNDVHVRRAVAYAINRADIIKAYGTTAFPVTTVIPPAQLYSIGSRTAVNALLKSLPQYPYSPAKARAEMAKSGYKNGASADFDTINYANFPDIAQVIATELGQVGIKLKVNVIPIDRWLSIIGGTDRTKVGINLVTPPLNSPDPSELPGSNLGSKNARAGHFNESNWAPADADRLIAAGLTTLDPVKRLAIYGQLLKRLATDMPFVPLCLNTANLALSDKFAWPTFSYSFSTRPWALEIKPA